jgi:hypothetical protein
MPRTLEVTLMRTRAQHWFADAERARQFMEPWAFGRAAKPGEIALGRSP